MKNVYQISVALLLAGAASAVNANLIQGGNFDTQQDLNDFWTQASTISEPTPNTSGTFWDAPTQTAHLGRPGYDGVSTLTQAFLVPTGADHLKIFFDYQWQVNRPNVEDSFRVLLLDDNDAVINELLSEGSASAVFNTTVSFAMQLDFLSALASPKGMKLQFELMETPNSPDNSGTRIQLDNVRAEIPTPATLALLGLGLAGIGYRSTQVKAA